MGDETLQQVDWDKLGSGGVQNPLKVFKLRSLS